ncbi:hypothetical protein [Sphingobium chungbukense]|uniref:hypothetical protein n=1 Tax=Sphingobium chungbukense TaxID=56193 RepID=UPI000A6CE0D6|nr:hypothetical protein [Sphingobium chungbukense]
MGGRDMCDDPAEPPHWKTPSRQAGKVPNPILMEIVAPWPGGNIGIVQLGNIGWPRREDMADYACAKMQHID